VSTTTGRAAHLCRRYSAPEVFENEPRNRLSDIWSLGCVLFEIMSRLRGIKLQTTKKFWKRNGNRYDSFAENPDATAAWFARLTEKHNKIQHGSNRSKLLVITFIYDILLEPNRVLRPNEKQVLERLMDFDLIYPDSTSSWVGECCSRQIGLSLENIPGFPDPSIKFRGDIPQWPVLDPVTLDNHLAYLFLDVSLAATANSENLSYLDSTGADVLRIRNLVSRDDAHTVKLATESMLKHFRPENISASAVNYLTAYNKERFHSSSPGYCILGRVSQCLLERRYDP
jgi:serine/threonine protein kinase